MFRLICIVMGYFIGCIQSAYIVGKIWHVDIRKHGSGNLGSTNALRVLGKKAAAITFTCDILKAVAAFVLGYYIFGRNVTAGIYAGAGAVLGHDFPFYLSFKGGKGIAATIGITLCLGAVVSPWIALVSYCLGIIGVLIKGYVSMGSLLFICSAAVMCFLSSMGTEPSVVFALMAALAVYQHRANISRILHGNENSLYKKKKA